MKITFDKESLKSKFLNPVSRVVDRCIVKVEKNKIYTVTNNDTKTIILYAVSNTKTDMKSDKTVSLNIPDIKRLNHVFSCIDDSNVTLEVNSNNLAYDSNGINFKYHLLDDGIIPKQLVSLDKIKGLKFTTEFMVTHKKLVEILKGTTFVSDVNKLYFKTKNKKVSAEITDKKVQNTDSIKFNIADSYTGSDIDTELPISLDIFRLIASIKSDVKVKINSKLKALMFDITGPDYKLKYIVSALVN